MYESVADKIKEIVSSMIEVDVRSDDDNVNEKEQNKNKYKRIIDNNTYKPVALPRERMPRRRPSFKNKWNPDSKKELMREYMNEYRSNGRDIETGHRYVKKLKRS